MAFAESSSSSPTNVVAPTSENSKKKHQRRMATNSFRQSLRIRSASVAPAVEYKSIDDEESWSGTWSVGSKFVKRSSVLISKRMRSSTKRLVSKKKKKKEQAPAKIAEQAVEEATETAEEEPQLVKGVQFNLDDVNQVQEEVTMTEQSDGARGVKFNLDDNKVHEVPRAEDVIWWTKQEMSQFRLQCREEHIKDKSVNKYLRYYRMCNLHFCTEFGLDADAPVRQLVIGMQKGHQGLERFSTFEKCRKSNIRSVVQTVIAAHQSSALVDKHLDDRTVDCTELVGKYSRKLSAKSTHWARILGNVAHQAVEYDIIEL